MAVKLEPCPFCGNERLIHNWTCDEGLISCSCGATMRAKTEEERFEQIGTDIYRKIPRKEGKVLVVEKWNRRVSEK